MSTATVTWNPGEPPKDGKYYLCWCTSNYGGGREIVRRPIVLRWADDDWGGTWEWDDDESSFWGTIEFHAKIEEPT